MAGLTLDHRGVRVGCPACGRINRRQYATVERPTRCGQCHADLPAVDAPVECPDASSFDALIAGSALPVVVDFWAPWCGPCRMMAPQFEQAARSLAGRALLVKVDTDAVPDLGARFGIRSSPTLAVFRGGHESGRVAGVQSASAIEAMASRA